MTELKDQLSLLGRKTEYKQDYAPEVLEAFDNKHPENDYWVRFNCPEFTSLCPITGQPDFAEIRISYIPDVKMVESKSLKLYLFSFRNHGAFHEDCVNIIMKDLIRLMNPKYIEVTGLFTPRGGISIYPYANYGRPGTRFEQLANIIMKDLIRLMNPKYIEVTGLFTPRGGISIYPYANYGRPGTRFEQLAMQRLASHE